MKTDSWIGIQSDLAVDNVFFLLQATSTTPRHLSRKHSVIPISELEKKFEGFRCSSPGDAYVSFMHLERVS